MTDKKVFCGIVEGIVFADRCLYELQKIIHGSKTCEECIYRELQRLKKGIVIEDRLPPKNKDRRKRTKATGKTRQKQAKSMKESKDIKDTKDGKEMNDIKKSLDQDTQGLKEELEKSTQDLRDLLILNVNELSKLLGKPKRRIQDLAQRGKIPGHKVGRHWGFPKEEIDKWLSEKKAMSLQCHDIAIIPIEPSNGEDPRPPDQNDEGSLNQGD